MPLDPSLIQQLKDQVTAASIAQPFKTNLLNKVAQLQNLSALSRSLAGLTQIVTKKGAKGVIPDADVQNILNLLDQIGSAL